MTDLASQPLEAVADRWCLPELLVGSWPESRSGEAVRSLTIGEREYLRFVRAVIDAPARSTLVDVLLDVWARVTPRTRTLDSMYATLFSLDQLRDVFGFEVSLARLESKEVALIPEVAAKYAISDSDAETLILAHRGHPVLTCRRSTSPRFWKAMYVNGIVVLDLLHKCGFEETPGSSERIRD